MKLSERMKQSRAETGPDAPTFGTVTTRANSAAESRVPVADDPVTQLKRRAQEALITRMGPDSGMLDRHPFRVPTRR